MDQREKRPRPRIGGVASVKGRTVEKIRRKFTPGVGPTPGVLQDIWSTTLCLNRVRCAKQADPRGGSWYTPRNQVAAIDLRNDPNPESASPCEISFEPYASHCRQNHEQ